MKKVLIILFVFFISVVSLAFDSTSIIHVTLTDSDEGLLHGTHYVKIKVIDKARVHTYFEDSQYISFENGFGEIKVGPLSDSLFGAQSLTIQVEIDNSVLFFPIYPSFLSIYAKYSDQLSDLDALYVDSGNVGLGTLTPDEKLVIDGNIKFLSSDASIIFSDEFEFNLSYLTHLTESISSINDYLSSDVIADDILDNLDVLVASIDTNINELAIISSSLDTVSSNVDDLASDVALISSQMNALPTEEGVVLYEQLLNSTPDDTGEIRFYDDSYYVYQSNDWVKLKTDLQYTDVMQIDVNSFTIASDLGAIGYDGSDYYLWNGAWQSIALQESIIDFSSLSLDSSLNEFIVIDADGKLYKRDIDLDADLDLDVDNSLSYESDLLSINSDLLDHSLVAWNGEQLVSVSVLSDSGLNYSDGILSLSDPIIVSQNQFVGIGISPTEMLDVNGAIRLRTVDSSIDEYSSGSIIFDGSDFLGWDGLEWQVLSNASVDIVENTDSVWVYNDTHLVAFPNHNVGINVSNPQATLDVSGNVRIRELLLNDAISNVIVSDADGDLFYRSIDFSSYVQHDDEFFDQFYSIPTLNINLGDIIYYDGADWVSSELLTNVVATMNIFDAFISTQNLSENDIIFYSNNDWQYGNPFQSSDDIYIDDFGFYISSKNADIGQSLMWNGSNWVPSFNVDSFSFVGDSVGDILVWDGTDWVVSENVDTLTVDFDFDSLGLNLGDVFVWDGNSWVVSSNVSYAGENGIIVSNDTISLDSNLSWANNTFVIGTESSAALEINRLSSNLINPVQIVDSNDDILFEVNSAGQLSIGFDGLQNGYSIASNGFNLFSHSISKYQSAIGTTNIGTTAFGPTLLIQAIESDSDEITDSRSVLEVLSITGNVLFEIQDGGNVGIGTPTPNATLDINGFVQLKSYDTPPVSCSIDHDGSIALTSQYTTCVCNGSNWVQTNDGSSACSW